MPSVEDGNDMKGAFAAQAVDGAYEKRTFLWVLLTYGTYSVTGGEWLQSDNTEKLSWMSTTPFRYLWVFYTIRRLSGFDIMCIHLCTIWALVL